MTFNFPIHTSIMIVLVDFLIMGALWLVISETLRTVTITPERKRLIRWGLLLAFLAVFVIRIVLGLVPGNEKFLAPNLVIVFFVVVIVIGTLPLMISPAFRQVILAVPMAWLVAVHVLRLAGGYFLTLLDARLLPADFALPAGYGDVLVACFSIGVVYALSRKYRGAWWLLILWNIFGFIDFGSALITGGQYIPQFGTNLVAAGGSVQYLNFVLLIPSFGVPVLALANIYVIYKMIRGQRG